MLGPICRIPIPPVFCSEETGAPFQRCLRCERDLQRGGVPYLIEKACRTFAGYDARETVFEYALCLPCYEAMSQAFSEASRRRIQAYMAEHVDVQRRAAERLRGPVSEVERWLDRCMVQGTPAAELSEYQMVAHCEGDRLVLSHLPALIGGPAVDALAELLSNRTLDALGGFRRDYLGPTPDLEELLTGPAPVLV